MTSRNSYLAIICLNSSNQLTKSSINQSIKGVYNQNITKYNKLHIVANGNEAMKSLFSYSNSHLLKVQAHTLYTTGNIITLITSGYHMINYIIILMVIVYIQYNVDFNYWLFFKFCRNWNLKQESVVECRMCSGNLFHSFVSCVTAGGTKTRDTLSQFNTLYS